MGNTTTRRFCLFKNEDIFEKSLKSVKTQGSRSHSDHLAIN